MDYVNPRGGRKKKDDLPLDARRVATVLRGRSVLDPEFMARDEITRGLHAKFWKPGMPRSWAAVRVHRGLPQLWTRGYLTAEAQNQTETRVDQRFVSPDGMAFPSGPTSFKFGIIELHGYHRTEATLVVLAANIQDIRSSLVEIGGVHGSEVPPGYPVVLLRRILNLAGEIEDAGSSLVSEGLGIHPYNRPGLGALMARVGPRGSRLSLEARYAGQFIEGLRSLLGSDKSRVSFER
jgi:hypothetical protein